MHHAKRLLFPVTLIRNRTKSRRGPAFAALALLAACGGTREPVVLAAVGQWDGADEVALRQGIELAVAEVNGSGGVGGRTLEVVFHDDKHDVAEAARVAQGLVDDPSVVGVIGHTRSDPTLVAMKVYDGRMPVVAARLHSPDLIGLSPWLFQSVPTDSAYSAAAVRFAAERGLGRAAVLFNNTARGRATAEHFQKQFRGELVGMDPAFFPAPLPGDLKVFVEYHRQVAPQMVFVPVGEPREYIDEVQRQGLRAAVVGWDVWSSHRTDPSLPGDFYHVVPFDFDASRPQTRAFVSSWRQRHGQGELNPFAALGYDATRLFADVAARVGTDRKAVRDALAALSPEHPYEGVTGPLSFTEDGSVAGPQPVVVRLRARAPGGAR